MRTCEVQFRIRDVYFPEPGTILDELHGDDLLRGRVVDLSESGPRGETFAVVEVQGLAQPLIVPQRCVEPLS